MLGIFVLNSQGQTGSMLYMFNHGLSTAALFLVTGFLISRRGSQLITDFGGVEKVAPVLAGHLPGRRAVVAVAAGPVAVRLGVPGAGRARSRTTRGTPSFAVLGIVLAALYILLMYQRTMTGPPRAAVAGITRPRRP